MDYFNELVTLNLIKQPFCKLEATLSHEPILFLSEEVDVRLINVGVSSTAYSLAAARDMCLTMEVDKNYILFFINDDSSVDFKLDQASLDQTRLSHGNILMFSYPYRNSLLTICPERDCKLYILAITIGKLHTLFGSDFGIDKDELNTFMGAFRMKQYFTNKPVHPEVAVIFHQIFNKDMPQLYLQAKVMEIISYFSYKDPEKSALEAQCPFVNDHLEMEKIKAARDIIIRDLLDPPSIRNLAREVGTNEFKLKVGFKSMYGATVYAYLWEYRMQRARKLFDLRNLNVKEVAHQIGYSNSSHFISAYKKKFGITPKKYLMRI